MVVRSATRLAAGSFVLVSLLLVVAHTLLRLGGRALGRARLLASPPCARHRGSPSGSSRSRASSPPPPPSRTRTRWPVERRPDAVRLVLSAPVEEAFLRLEARTADGRLVSGPARRDPRDARAIVAPLRAPGTARITWRVLSQDGHPTGGVVAVGAAAGAPGPSPVRGGAGPLPVLARLLVLLAPVALLGLVVLSAAVVAPAVLRRRGLRAGRAARGRGGLPGPGRRRPRRGVGRVVDRLVVVRRGRAPPGLILLPVALLRGLRAGPGELGTLLGDTRAGAAWWVQAGGAGGRGRSPRWRSGRAVHRPRRAPGRAARAGAPARRGAHGHLAGPVTPRPAPTAP